MAWLLRFANTSPAPLAHAPHTASLTTSTARVSSSGIASAYEGRHTPRDPGEALMSATHDADRILQQLKSALSAGDLQPSAMLSVVGEWVDRVSRLAKVRIDARIEVRRVELEAEKLQLVRVALGRAIVAAELEPGQRTALLRAFALELRAEVTAVERRSEMRALPPAPERELQDEGPRTRSVRGRGCDRRAATSPDPA